MGMIAWSQTLIRGVQPRDGNTESVGSDPEARGNTHVSQRVYTGRGRQNTQLIQGPGSSASPASNTNIQDLFDVPLTKPSAQPCSGGAASLQVHLPR